MRIALLRLYRVAFLAATIPCVASLTSKQTKIVQQCDAIAQDDELVVSSFCDQFHSLEQKFEEDRNTILDNIHQVTNDMLAKWEEENKELAEICRMPSTKCKEATAAVERTRKEEIAMVTIEFPRQKTDAMQSFLSEFVDMEFQRMESEDKLVADLNSIHDILSSLRRKVRRRIEAYLNEDIGRVERAIADLEELGDQLQKTIEELNAIVYGNLCFEFVGATKSIEHVSAVEYNDAMKKSLEFAFVEEKVDVEVVDFQVVGEILSGKMYNNQRTLRELLRTPTRSANVVGVRCRCKTNGPVSDVGHRRNLDEISRDLFSPEIMTTFATVLREELPIKFGDLESVSTFHCSDFDFESSVLEVPAAAETAEKEPTFFLRLPGHGCENFQVKNLGTDFHSPEECGDAAMVDHACSGGNEIMWSQYSYDWGCRCCLANPMPDGNEAYTPNVNWNIYQYKELDVAPVTNFKMSLYGYGCNRFTAKNLGTEFQTPEECGSAAMMDPACDGNEIMWSPYSFSWGCMCCSPNPIPGEIEAYTENVNWSVYQYKELEIRTDYRLRLMGHNCGDFEAKNLGTDFSNAKECADAARDDAVCTGDEIMWSQYSYSWGCRCCLSNPGIGDEEYTASANWDIYQFD